MLLAALSYLVAIVLYPALHLSAILPVGWGRLALTALGFALVANPWSLRARGFPLPVAFGGSLLTLALFFGLALWQTPADDMLQQAFLSVHYLLGPVALFWCWIGLDVFNGAHDLAAWVTRTLKALLSGRALGLAILTVWLVWMAFATLLVHRPVPPVELIELLLQHGWTRALLQAYARPARDLWPSPAFVAAAQAHLYLMVLFVLGALVLRLARRLCADRLLGLFGLSLLTLFALWSGYGLFYATASGEARPLGSWPLVTFVAGMSWQVLKTSSGLVTRGKVRSLLFVGLLVLLGSISLLELSVGNPLFEAELSLNTLLGVLYLGIPYLLYKELYGRLECGRMPGSRLALLFVLGMASAMPALVSGRPCWAPVVWALVAAAALWRWGAWQRRWDGLVAALSLGLG